VHEGIVLKVQFNNQYRPTSLGVETDFNGYLSAGIADMDIYFFSNASVDRTKQKQIVQTISEKKICGYVSFIALTIPFAELAPYALDDLLTATESFTTKKNFIIKSDFSVEESGEYDYSAE
jgi:hypothetical protein